MFASCVIDSRYAIRAQEKDFNACLAKMEERATLMSALRSMRVQKNALRERLLAEKARAAAISSEIDRRQSEKNAEESELGRVDDLHNWLVSMDTVRAAAKRRLRDHATETSIDTAVLAADAVAQANGGSFARSDRAAAALAASTTYVGTEWQRDAILGITADRAGYALSLHATRSQLQELEQYLNTVRT